ncbi:hypothetical protein OPT61_g8279 [Boeremia exigua]|uniref:Uncharacterized protein n=1 Tax=Boeremia exigua TaxID=749465 RepID=A0ACC2HZ96_9PLEO|nr:hypothetical protein OPT61_g8279 [Boeremia exigua]
MSALDQLREVMSTAHDLVKDYDSDAVSLSSSTAESGLFDASCIIAEDPVAEKCYLVSWEGYPLNEAIGPFFLLPTSRSLTVSVTSLITTNQLPGTWEPPENLDGTDLISTWEHVKKDLGDYAFRHENQKNRDAYEQARQKAKVVKSRRLAKRKRLRQDLQRRDHRAIFDDSSDEEAVTPARTGDTLFVEPHEPPRSTLPVDRRSPAQQPPVERRPPLQQSSSEDSNSEAEQLDNSSSRLQGRNAPRSEGKSASKDPQGSHTLAKEQTVGTTVSFTTMPEANMTREKLKQKSTAPAAPAAHNRPATTDSSNTSTSVHSKPTVARAVRTAPQAQTSRAINFVDQPHEKQRQDWSTDNQYKKLKYRGLAEKRSRVEAAPDFSALSFPNGPPPTLPKTTASKPDNNPYGRREATTRRVQEDDEDDRPRRGPTDEAAPLASWETEKVPMICFHYYSGSCPYGPQKCKFLHRKVDPRGRPYQIGDYEGRVPQKYRRPPITCPFWYKGRKCNKTAEQCLYAHEDTGWAEINGVPIKIDHMPPSSTLPPARDGSTHRLPKLMDPPITCSYWLRDPRGCALPEDDCKYAHWNTGWAHPEFDIKAPPERIDPNIKPRGVPPKYANTPVTCPFWLRSEKSCTKTDDDCRYAHRNTGWAPSGLSLGDALPIDPQQLPRSQSLMNVPSTTKPAPPPESNPQSDILLTCPSWLRDAGGCPIPEHLCSHAHMNTGWATPNGRPYAAPVPLDPNQIPRFQREQVGGNNPQPDVLLTCPSWLRDAGGCPIPEHLCSHAHMNTGWATPNGRPYAAPVPLDPNQIPRFQREQFRGGPTPTYAKPPVSNTGWLPTYGEGGGPSLEIDRAEKPRSDGLPPGLTSDRMAPKNAVPPITCYFWLKVKGGCAKSDTDCRFAHRNTGWVIDFSSGPGSKPEQVDPRMLPQFRKHDSTDPSQSEDSRRNSLKETTSSSRLDEPAVGSPQFMSEVTANDMVHSPMEMQDVQRTAAVTATTCPQLGSKIEKLWHLDIIEMFSSGIPGDTSPLERQAMLLYHPEEHSEEIDLITRWLLMHSVKVFNLWYDGAWDQFREDVAKHKSGVIIAHPEFEYYLDLPGFGGMLKERVRVWSVGLQPPATYEFGVDPGPPKLQHDRVGIFPHGGLIYITDDVFEQKPQLALSIVKRFFAKIERLRSLDGPVSPWLEVHDACVLWRLCVRPELMEYLFLKCEHNPKELEAGNPDYLSRAELYQLLTLNNYIDQDHPIEPLSLVQDQYPILSERREIAEHAPLDYFNRLEASQEDANTHMVGYYAAMQSADMRRAYRQFYVVHTEPGAPCAQQWKTSIHNIADVITPERCIKELSKASKESLFDFLDWAMSPKEKNSGDVVMGGTSLTEIHEVEHTAY